MIIFLLVAGFTVWVNAHVLQHDVFLDWRPYKVGNNITELMKIPKMGKPVVEMTYTYKNKSTGELKEVLVISGGENESGMKELSAIASDKNYTYVDRKDVVKDPGFVAKISDFAVNDENNVVITDKIPERYGLSDHGGVGVVWSYFGGRMEKRSTTGQKAAEKRLSENVCTGRWGAAILKRFVIPTTGISILYRWL